VSTDLATLLVEEGVVAAEAVERALARQREAGGALDTALLELGVVDEARLTAVLSRAAGLPAAPPTAWEASDPRARRVFPSRVAERHGLAPFALDGRELSLVATHPVDLGLLDEISFMLSLHLTAHVGPEWRVRGLIHRLYGGPLEPRLAALAEAGPAPSFAAAPPPAAPAGPLATPEEVVDVTFDEPAPPPPPEPAAPPLPPPPPAQATGFARDASEPLEPLAAALAQALESEDFPWLEEEEPVAIAPSAVPRTPSAEPPAAGEGSGEEPAPEEPAAPADRSAPPRWTVEEARAALAAAGDRDAVVVAALRYARDFFQFAAMFAVTRDAVAGHDALGAGDEDARARCRGVAIYASDPGIFRTVIEAKAPYLGPVAHEVSGNEAILAGLGRGAPRTVLVHPILLRDRAVCVLYADNGEAPVSARRLGDLLTFLSTVGAAFERVIQARKRRRRRPAPAPPPEEVPEFRPVEPTPPSPPVAAAPPPEGPLEPAPPTPEAPEPWRAIEPARTVPPSAPPAEGPAAPPAAPEPDIDVDVEEPAEASPAAVLPDEVPPARAPSAVAAPAGPPALQPAPPPVEPDQAAVALLATAPGSPERAEAVARLAEDGTAAVTALFARLPGDQAGAGAGAPAEFGPLAAALVAIGKPAVPALVEALQDPHAARRRAAAALLGAIGEPAAFPALAERALDASPEVAAEAAAALGAHRRHPAMRAIPERLRRALLSGGGVRAAGAARALGELRDLEAIPLLVQALETPDRAPAEVAAEALARITLQRLGTDPRRWLPWWKENRGRGRAEWLLSGLTSADREVRAAAAEELARAAPPPVPYSPDAPPEERESAARAWAGWWARSGQVL